MCGYAQRERASKKHKLQRILEWFEVDDFPDGRFFPGTKMTGVIIEDGAGVRTVDATWWFELKEKDGALKPDRKRDVFNARNLAGNYWKRWLKTHRCVIPVTAIVETLNKQSYLMEAEDGLLLGGLYQTWEHEGQTVYSCAVITCDPHDRFKKYHDKSTPLFLPMDEKLIATWLDPSFNDIQYFSGIIDSVKLPTDFTVTPVKNSRTLEVQGAAELLERD